VLIKPKCANFTERDKQPLHCKQRHYVNIGTVKLFTRYL